MFHSFLRTKKFHVKRYSKKTTGSQILKNFLKMSDQQKKEKGLVYDHETEGYYQTYQNDSFKEEEEENNEEEEDFYYDKDRIHDLLEDVAKDLMSNDPSFKKFEHQIKEATKEVAEDPILAEEGEKIVETNDRFHEKKVEIEIDLELYKTFDFFSVDFEKQRPLEVLEYEPLFKIDKFDYNYGEYKYVFKNIDGKIKRHKYRVQKVKKKLPPVREVQNPENITIPLIKKDDVIPKSLEEIEELEKIAKKQNIEVNFENEKRDLKKHKRIKIYDDNEITEEFGDHFKPEQKDQEDVKDIPQTQLSEEEMKKLSESITEKDYKEQMELYHQKIQDLQSKVARGETAKEDEPRTIEDDIIDDLYGIYKSKRVDFFHEKFPEMSKQELGSHLEIMESYPFPNPEIEARFDSILESIMDIKFKNLGEHIDDVIKYREQEDSENKK